MIKSLRDKVGLLLRRNQELPIYSTIAAITEIFVTAAVLYVIALNLGKHRFPVWLLVGTVLFELVANISYMVIRLQHVEPHLTGSLRLLAMTHGILSLIAFILLIILTILAIAAQKAGRFFFHEKRWITYPFVVIWLASVLSGEVIYFSMLLPRS